VSIRVRAASVKTSLESRFIDYSFTMSLEIGAPKTPKTLFLCSNDNKRNPV